jgi:hypothetical protein
VDVGSDIGPCLLCTCVRPVCRMCLCTHTLSAADVRGWVGVGGAGGLTRACSWADAKEALSRWLSSVSCDCRSCAWCSCSRRSACSSLPLHKAGYAWPQAPPSRTSHVCSKARTTSPAPSSASIDCTFVAPCVCRLGRLGRLHKCTSALVLYAMVHTEEGPGPEAAAGEVRQHGGDGGVTIVGVGGHQHHARRLVSVRPRVRCEPRLHLHSTGECHIRSPGGKGACPTRTSAPVRRVRTRKTET